MATDRCVRWSTDALDFFESSPDNSLVLDVIISHACASQTGEGFEELVNSINSDDIKRKIKKVNITDTSYLYRHSIPVFAKHSNTNIPTLWFVNNKDSIEKLTVDVEFKSWATGVLNNDAFEHWLNQIKIDFAGDGNGNGIIREFRELIIADAAVATYKESGTFAECVDFLLEESAYVIAHLNNAAIVYPVIFTPSFFYIINRYANIRQFCYKISKQAQHNRNNLKNYTKEIDQEIVSFMKDTVSNVNFYVIDKYGNYICRNREFDRVAGEKSNARELDETSWRACIDVMEEKKQRIIEEKFNSTYYLSVKAPLVIDGEVEGVIGLAVDITDRKKAQQIEQQNKLKVVFEQVAHDIRSPLAALSMLTRSCKGLSEKEHIALRNISTSIENITSNLLNKYNGNDVKKYVEPADIRFSEQYISIYISLLEILNNKRCQYRDLSVTFNFSCDPTDNFAFIRGDYSDFCRMISNIINNSVEALEGSSGIIEVSFSAKDQKVEIGIKDNGKGMPREMVDKIMSNVPVGSTKESGYGIGMQQIKNTLQQMNGQMSIKSTENVGTEITLMFPESEPPAWVAEQIVLHKGEIVVVLDDDPSIHSVWEKRLCEYSSDITIKYFTQGDEAIDFINSLKQKDKILLLTDYELRNQDINGIDVIEKTNMQKQSIVVTSVYTYKIKNFSEKTKFLKMVSKLYMNEIPIVMEKDRKTETADIVFIDDNKIFTQTLADFFENRRLIAHTYNSPDAFLKNLSQYSKDTKIVIDNELNSEISGLELAKQLHEQGYANLYLFSGRPFNENEVPPYLTVIFKGSEDFMEKLL